MTLFDQFGRPIKAIHKKPEPRQISVAGIQDRWSTYPSNGLTPPKLADILKAADNGDVLRQAELFEEMEEKDAHLASQFSIRKSAVAGLEWEILPADDTAPAKNAAEFCKEVVDGLIDFDEHLLDLLDALAKGYSVMELLWDTSEGKALIRALSWIHPKKITFWNSMTPRVLTEENPVEGIDMAPFKWVYHRHKARSGYDTRAGIMRTCTWMYLFKNYDVKDWVGFAEVFGKPLRLGKYDAGASKNDKDALALAVRSLGSDAAGIISKSTEIEFVQATISGSLNIYESLASFCDAQVSKAVLGQVLTSDSGSDGSGSYALGRVHADVRQDLVEADAKALSRTLTHQVLKPLVGFNFGWDAPMPTFSLIHEPPEDMEAVGRIYQVVSNMIEISQEHVSQRFKIPMIQKGETPLKTKKTPGEGAAGALEKHALKRLLPHRLTPEQQAIEDLCDRGMAQVYGQFEGNEAKILKAVQDASDYDEAMENLLNLYPDLQVDILARLIERCGFAGSVFGRHTVQNGR